MANFVSKLGGAIVESDEGNFLGFRIALLKQESHNDKLGESRCFALLNPIFCDYVALFRGRRQDQPDILLTRTFKMGTIYI